MNYNTLLVYDSCFVFILRRLSHVRFNRIYKLLIDHVFFLIKFTMNKMRHSIRNTFAYISSFDFFFLFSILIFKTNARYLQHVDPWFLYVSFAIMLKEIFRKYKNEKHYNRKTSK